MFDYRLYYERIRPESGDWIGDEALHIVTTRHKELPEGIEGVIGKPAKKRKSGDIVTWRWPAGDPRFKVGIIAFKRQGYTVKKEYEVEHEYRRDKTKVAEVEK